MSTGGRVVVDTNVLVSRLILPLSIPAQSTRKAELQSVLLFSDATMSELADVLARDRFDDYITRDDRKGFVNDLCGIAEFVPIIQRVRECRDPRDDKFLEVALKGSAEAIITGDADLLALHPWREIAILTPGQYLQR
jgi:putative PIN family toxin of toxin-antitoxin system